MVPATAIGHARPEDVPMARCAEKLQYSRNGTDKEPPPIPTQLEAAPKSVPTAVRPGRAGRVREGVGLESRRVLSAIRVRNAIKKTCKASVGIYFAVTAPRKTPSIMPGVIRRTVAQSMACFLCWAYILEKVVNTITAKEVPMARCWA